MLLKSIQTTNKKNPQEYEKSLQTLTRILIEHSLTRREYQPSRVRSETNLKGMGNNETNDWLSRFLSKENIYFRIIC